MLAIDGSWIGPGFKRYCICFKFILIDRSHIEESLAQIIFKALEKYNLLPKFLAITVDNASNNDTAIQELHIKLCKIYDDHLPAAVVR